MIGKREYNKAKKVVLEYEKQLLNKPAVIASLWGFLWWSYNGVEHHRWIKAKTIDTACKRFLASPPKTIEKIDYEVQNGENYVDISERKEFKDWL